MTIFRNVAAAACLAILASPASIAAADDAPPSYEDDARILGEALRELYPSYDRFGQGKDIDVALKDLTVLSRNAPTPMEFYRSVTEVAAAARDEHVIPFPSDAYRATRREGQVMLPYTVRWIAGEPYVAAIADPAHQEIVGRRVMAFDGKPASEVLATLRALIPSDGLSETFAIRRLQDFTPTQNENYFDLNYPIWFGAKATYSITFEGDAGPQQLELPALDWPAFSDFYSARLPREVPMEFRWLNESTGYLSVRSFHDWYYEEHGIDAAGFLSSMLQTLAERPGAALILDLRQNEGGGDISSLLLDHLLLQPFKEYDRVLTQFVGQPAVAQYCENAGDVAFDPAWADPAEDGQFQLKQEFLGLITGALERAPREDAFAGELVVLISGTTGSAAAKVSAVLKREGRARFVGEETGGAAAGATAFGYCSLRLPASGIKVDMPLIRFERAVDVPYGRGIMPDMRVDGGRTPPVTQRDEALETALALLDASS